jgi:hypothetical protein
MPLQEFVVILAPAADALSIVNSLLEFPEAALDNQEPVLHL